MNVIACQYPIVSKNRADYLAGHEYVVRYRRVGSDRFTRSIEHSIHGDNLVSSLVRDGHANFVCLIDSPWCAYREIKYGNLDLLRTEDDRIWLSQQLDLHTPNFSAPVLLHTAVLATDDLHNISLSKKYGVNSLWDGVDISIPKGAKVAIGPHFTSDPTTTSILRITKAMEGELTKGSFRVGAVPEEGFYFKVDVEPSLYHQLKNATNATHHCESIYCFALSQGMEILKANYSDSDVWQEHFYLRQLRKLLIEAGSTTWEDPDFDANQAVAKLQPHYIPIEEDHHEEGTLF